MCVVCYYVFKKVIPLFKSDDRCQVSNYRPVSILPQLSKILQKLFNTRLLSFINKYDILCNSQFGVREGHSTTQALMEMVENMTSSIDYDKITTGVYIDLKKPFDTIDHSILCSKLKHYGIRGIVLSWLEYYLSNRHQFVSYNNFDSEKLQIVCGVPQGSILGPILSLLYIYDLCNISKLFKFILCADDTNIFYTGNNIEEVEQVLNILHIIKVHSWKYILEYFLSKQNIQIETLIQANYQVNDLKI